MNTIRNFSIITHIVAAKRLLENPRFSTGFALLSDTGKLQFSRPLSIDVCPHVRL